MLSPHLPQDFGTVPNHLQNDGLHDRCLEADCLEVDCLEADCLEVDCLEADCLEVDCLELDLAADCLDWGEGGWRYGSYNIMYYRST